MFAPRILSEPEIDAFAWFDGHPPADPDAQLAISRSPFIALAELAHRAAHAPIGDVGLLRFTLVGAWWNDPAAADLEALRLAVFRSIEDHGAAAAVTPEGARALGDAGLSLPPRLEDLVWLRRDFGADEPAGGQTYITRWLAPPPALKTAARPKAARKPGPPQQLTLALSVPRRRRCSRRPAAA